MLGKMENSDNIRKVNLDMQQQKEAHRADYMGRISKTMLPCLTVSPDIVFPEP